MTTTQKNKRLIILLSAALSLLLIPLIAMQFSPQVNWSAFDFAVMGVLLLITAGAFEFVLRKIRNKENRIALIAIIIIAFLLIWAELAIGVFGTPFAGN